MFLLYIFVFISTFRKFVLVPFDINFLYLDLLIYVNDVVKVNVFDVLRVNVNNVVFSFL